MKNLVLSVIYTILGILMIAVIMTVYNRINRAAELQTNLSSVTEEAVENIMLKTDYEITDTQQFLADLTQYLCFLLDADSDITIDIMSVDIEKGLVSLKVIENYRHINGKTGQVSCEKTVIFNAFETEAETEYMIAFYLSYEDMQQNQNCYKKYNVRAGETLTLPKNPRKDGKLFAGWKCQDGTNADFSVPLTETRSYYAVWN